VYKEVDTFKRGIVPRTSFIRSERGKVVSDPVGIKNKMEGIFQQTL
jgi:hypothetical protein